jgi:hypothetical protein
VLQRSGLFDEQFYLKANPDVAAAKSPVAAARRGQENPITARSLSVRSAAYNTLPIYLEAAVRSVMRGVPLGTGLLTTLVERRNTRDARVIASWDNRIFVARNAAPWYLRGRKWRCVTHARYVAMLHYMTS